MSPASMAGAKHVWEQIAGWTANMFEVVGLPEVSHEPFSPFIPGLGVRNSAQSFEV